MHKVFKTHGNQPNLGLRIISKFWNIFPSYLLYILTHWSLLLSFSTPLLLPSSAPQLLSSSAPHLLTSSPPHLLSSSHPLILSSSHPLILSSSPPLLSSSTSPGLLKLCLHRFFETFISYWNHIITVRFPTETHDNPTSGTWNNFNISDFLAAARRRCESRTDSDGKKILSSDPNSENVNLRRRRWRLRIENFSGRLIIFWLDAKFGLVGGRRICQSWKTWIHTKLSSRLHLIDI